MSDTDHIAHQLASSSLVDNVSATTPPPANQELPSASRPDSDNASSNTTKPTPLILSRRSSSSGSSRSDQASSRKPSSSSSHLGYADSPASRLNDAVRDPSISPLPPVDDVVVQAMRKRDDRIFFIQHEWQMVAFLQDDARQKLDLPPMNSYQRLLTHRCADQFNLNQTFDRLSQVVTLSKTADTFEPSILLSQRARDRIVEVDGIDRLNSATSAIISSTAPSSTASTPPPSARAMSPSASSSSSAAPPAGFKIMRRDPSAVGRRGNRMATSASASGDNSDTDRASSKARKDMTMEEREAAYKAARARIFGDLDSNATPSSASSASHHEEGKETGATAAEAAATSDSAASSPIASTSARKKASCSSSVDGSEKTGTNRSKPAARKALHEAAEDDWEFSRALPLSAASSSSSSTAWPQQPSPLGYPATANPSNGYFPNPIQIQQSHSNPNLRARAPAFHPPGTSTPALAAGGVLRYPHPHHLYTAAQDGSSSSLASVSSSASPHRSPTSSAPGSRSTSTSSTSQAHGNTLQSRPSHHDKGSDVLEHDQYPALSSAETAAGRSVRSQQQRQPQQQNAWAHRSNAASALGNHSDNAWQQQQQQQQQMNGIGAWAQQTATHTNGHQPVMRLGGVALGSSPNGMLAYQHTQPHQQPYGYPVQTQTQDLRRLSSSNNSASSRSNSIRTAPNNNREDAVSVTSASSSRSADPNNASASTAPKMKNITHHSLPAKPVWLQNQNQNQRSTASPSATDTPASTNAAAASETLSSRISPK